MGGRQDGMKASRLAWLAVSVGLLACLAFVAPSHTHGFSAGGTSRPAAAGPAKSSVPASDRITRLRRKRSTPHPHKAEAPQRGGIVA